MDGVAAGLSQILHGGSSISSVAREIPRWCMTAVALPSTCVAMLPCDAPPPENASPLPRGIPPREGPPYGPSSSPLRRNNSSPVGVTSTPTIVVRDAVGCAGRLKNRRASAILDHSAPVRPLLRAGTGGGGGGRALGSGERASIVPGDGLRPDGDCCTTCVSSCASNRRPAVLVGRYSPAPNTRWWPTVYARASTSRADCCASAPACTRTCEKSCPNRCSIS